MKAIALGCLAGVLVLSLPATALAQESKSAPLAKQLAAALDAAKDPSSSDVFCGALYVPGVELLVGLAKYTAPQLLNARLAKKEYRDVYIDLNSASVPSTKIFISDLGADGLQPKKNGNKPFDTVDINGKTYTLDGEWGKAKISQDEYMKAYEATEAEYVKMLEALVAQIKKSS